MWNKEEGSFPDIDEAWEQLLSDQTDEQDAESSDTAPSPLAQATIPPLTAPPTSADPKSPIPTTSTTKPNHLSSDTLTKSVIAEDWDASLLEDPTTDFDISSPAGTLLTELAEDLQDSEVAEYAEEIFAESYPEVPTLAHEEPIERVVIEHLEELDITELKQELETLDIAELRRELEGLDISELRRELDMLDTNELRQELEGLDIEEIKQELRERLIAPSIKDLANAATLAREEKEVPPTAKESPAPPPSPRVEDEQGYRSERQEEINEKQRQASKRPHWREELSSWSYGEADEDKEEEPYQPPERPQWEEEFSTWSYDSSDKENNEEESPFSPKSMFWLGIAIALYIILRVVFGG